MKYINVKTSHHADYKPLTIKQFMETTVYSELQELESCLASHSWGAFVIVKRNYDQELQVICIDPDFMPDMKTNVHREDALAWHVAIKEAYKSPVLPQSFNAAAPVNLRD